MKDYRFSLLLFFILLFPFSCFQMSIQDTGWALCVCIVLIMLGVRSSWTKTSKAKQNKSRQTQVMVAENQKKKKHTEGLNALKIAFFNCIDRNMQRPWITRRCLIHSSALTLKERITFEKVCKERSDVLDHISIMFAVLISLNLTILMIWLVSDHNHADGDGDGIVSAVWDSNLEKEKGGEHL